MDQIELQGLKTRADQARSFQIEHNGKTYSLRLPTQWDVRRLAARATDTTSGELEMFQQLRYEIVKHALYGWQGVQVRDAFRAVQDSSDELEFSETAVEALLAQDTGLLDALSMEAFARINKRDKALEDDAKNSSSASPTNTSETKRENS